MDEFGFIITRHVNSQKTNEYWNRSVSYLNHLYPTTKIVIIDDNSNYDFIKPKKEHKNLEIIQSEYPGRGELLPYYYFYKQHFFKNAIIIHDSVFFHKRISFEKLAKFDVLPFWEFPADKENHHNSMRLISTMKNNKFIHSHLDLQNLSFPIREISKNNTWNGCFGVQSYINHTFLSSLVDKYDIFKLLNHVKCRADRCCLERIFGILFSLESKFKSNSLFGNIHSYQSFDYNYDKYTKDLIIHKKLPHPIVKVWTGR